MMQASQSDVSFENEIQIGTTKTVTVDCSEVHSVPAQVLQPSISRGRIVTDNEYFKKISTYSRDYSGLEIFSHKQKFNTEKLTRLEMKNSSYYLIPLILGKVHFMYDIHLRDEINQDVYFNLCADNNVIGHTFTENIPLEIFKCKQSNISILVPICYENDNFVETNTITVHLKWGMLRRCDGEDWLPPRSWSFADHCRGNVFYFNDRIISSEESMSTPRQVDVFTTDRIFNLSFLPLSKRTNLHSFNTPCSLNLGYDSEIKFDTDEFIIEHYLTSETQFYLKPREDIDVLTFTFETAFDVEYECKKTTSHVVPFGTNAFYINNEVRIVNDSVTSCNSTVLQKTEKEESLDGGQCIIC